MFNHQKHKRVDLIIKLLIFHQKHKNKKFEEKLKRLLEETIMKVDIKQLIYIIELSI